MAEFTRDITPLDRLIVRLDRCLSRLVQTPAPARPSPGDQLPEADLDPGERVRSAGLMRVNHAGEVCAQALYLGQAATARTEKLRDHLQVAAAEEADHLAWCKQRLRELDARPSYLDPLWYGGSFALGALAGLAGDRWSLGFVAETERQVEQHLAGHGLQLSPADHRSRAIIEQMQIDEARHGQRAMQAGGVELPVAVRQAMRLASRLMTGSSYWI